MSEEKKNKFKTKTYYVCDICNREISFDEKNNRGILVDEDKVLRPIKSFIDLRINWYFKAGAYHISCMIKELFDDVVVR